MLFKLGTIDKVKSNLIWIFISPVSRFIGAYFNLGISHRNDPFAGVSYMSLFRVTQTAIFINTSLIYLHKDEFRLNSRDFN